MTRLPTACERVNACDYPGISLCELASLLRRQGWLLIAEGFVLVRVRLH